MVRALSLPARGAGVVWRLGAALALVATLLVGLLAQPGGVAAATALTVNGGWTAFGFNAVGSPAAQEPFTYSTSVAYSAVTVTDCYETGDRFAVYDNNVLLGETSAVATGQPTVNDPDCLSNPQFSTGTFFLAPGAHSITIVTTASPYGGGVAFLQVTAERIPTETAKVRGDAAYGDTTALLTATVTYQLQQGPAAVPAAIGPPVPAGGQVRFSLFGQVVGIGLTNAQGVATFTAPLPPGLAAGTYPGKVKAEYLENPEFSASTGVGPLVIGRRLLWVKPVDRNVGLKQPNPPTDPHLDPANCAAPNWCLELANGSTFAPGETFANLDLSLLRFQYARNPPSTNSVEKVGSTYRITAFGVNVKNYDIRYLPGTMKVVAATP